MSRSEVRTREGWAGFDTMAWVIALILFLLWLVTWWSRKDAPDGGTCCGNSAVAVAPPPAVVAPIPAPAPAAVPTPAPVAVAPAMAVVDCAKIMEGVSVAFEVNRAVLSEAGKQALDQTVVCLKDGKYEVAGHTDSDGSDASNQTLSVSRATAAVNYLKTKGIAADRMLAAGYGESKPIADNATAEGKARNRRITFTPK